MILKRTTVTETIEYKKAKPGEARESRLRTIGSLDHNPYIRLSGKWLRDALFVKVVVSKTCKKFVAYISSCLPYCIRIGLSYQ